MKALRKSIYTILAAASLVSVFSCEKDKNEDASGKEIQFCAATTFENAVGTKTEYSGVFVKDNQYEMINWLPGEDRIRILCKNAQGGPKADYDITEAKTKVDNNSYAEIKPTGSKLFWGEGDHYFFSLYPAPGMKSEIGGEVLDSECQIELGTDGTEATVKGFIPSEQTGKWDAEKRIFKPNMNYAYMAAALNAKQGEKVQLSFKPLVTTLEFNLLASGDKVAASTLVSLVLKSTSTKLAGSFSTTLKPDNTHSEPVLSDTEDEVSIDLSNAGIQLSKDKPTRITVLSLPVNQTDLVATLTFDDGTEKSLALKKDGEAITISACKKVYIWNLGVPDDVVTYEFDVNPETLEFSAAGGEDDLKNYSITSYKTVPGKDREPVGWTITFDTEDGSKPSWLDKFTSEGSGDSEEVTLDATVRTNKGKSQSGWPGIGSNDSEDKAQDLSLKDGSHESTGLSTANCYVVTGPGWYKFPAVYGNSLVNGVDNQKAYHYVDGNGNPTDVLDGEAFTPFVNSEEKPISTPWIINDVSATSVEAVLCWQDSEDLLSGWSFKKDEGEGGYVYFFVNPETIAYGNAILAIKSEDHILWSWHIWVSLDKHEGTTILKARDLPSTNVDSNEMLNVPVGWCEPETFVAEKREVWATATQAESGKTVRFLISQKDTTSYTYGNHPYYQWGRKDPMLPASGEIKKADDKTHFGEYKWKIENASASMGTVIQNPNVFYGGNVNGSWFIEADYNDEHHSYWDSGMGKGHNIDRMAVKTVYDPCPVGFSVPNRNAFTLFSNSEKPEQNETGAETFNSPNGDMLIEGNYYSYYHFFSSPEGSVVTIPVLGYREKGGALKNVSLKAYAWTASTNGYYGHDASRLFIALDNGGTVHPLSNWYIKFGFPIFSVKEH